MRKISKKGAKAKAWKAFARFIKARDANSKGMVSCCTCNKWMRWDEPDCQAGHFIGGRKNAVLFDEMGVHGQCLTGESNIRMSDGVYKNIKEIECGDLLDAFDELSFYKCNAVVINVSSFIPEELYEVRLEDGTKFFATPDHKVISNGEWVSIENMLQHVSDNDIMQL